MTPLSTTSTDSILYETWMARCLELATSARGLVHPNPMVGCVVLDRHDNIIGEGAHRAYGQAHAEVDALDNCCASPEGGTLVVNLEPCSHTGKTPPCVERVIASGVKRVIIGMSDPNPLVSGRGIAALQAAGLEIIVGIREAECLKLNEAFCHFIQHQTPFVVLKQAMTLDGATATENGHSQWITNPEARQFAHELRAQSDAILSTSKSVITDNSLLTVRDVDYTGKAPLRVILDRQGQLQPQLALFKEATAGDILIITLSQLLSTLSQRFEAYPHVQVLGIEALETAQGTQLSLSAVFKKLGELGICQVLVEAGGTLAGSLLENRQLHKAWLVYGNGILADQNAMTAFAGKPKHRINEMLPLDIVDIKRLNGNIALEVYPR